MEPVKLTHIWNDYTWSVRNPSPAEPLKMTLAKNSIWRVNDKDDAETTKQPVNQPARTLSLVERLSGNLSEQIPDCSCPMVKRRTTSPYYTQLGAAPDMAEIRRIVEERSGLVGSAIHIVKVCHAKKEGTGPEGCPMPNDFICRGAGEKLLVLCRSRSGHRCETAVLIIGIVLWEGVPEDEASQLYSFMTENVATAGVPTKRAVATNKTGTCACQGVGDQAGKSYSFGCSYLYFWDTCRHACKNTAIRKFRLKPSDQEPALEEKLVRLATTLKPVFRSLAPDCFRNMTYFGGEGQSCRLGENPDQPFSGVTVCMDFSTHRHKDYRNMRNGCTMVVTLKKHHDSEQSSSQESSQKSWSQEQMHVLPGYFQDPTDEYGQRRRQDPNPDHSYSLQNAEIGGVAIALSHGSVLFEVAVWEPHATTAVETPNRYNPTRISLVFYQHKKLNCADHGSSIYEKNALVWKLQREARKATESIFREATESIFREAEATPSQPKTEKVFP